MTGKLSNCKLKLISRGGKVCRASIKRDSLADEQENRKDQAFPLNALLNSSS